MIGAVIGPGGKVIQDIQKTTGTTITITEVDNKGIVDIFGQDKTALDGALNRIKAIVAIPEIGETYHGKIRSIVTFGAFVEIMPGKDALLHISEIDYKRFETMEETGLKEGDEIAQQMESTNAAELLFFSDKAQVYKLKAADFADTKASVMGEYVPARVQMDEGESAAYMAVTTDFKGYMLFVFDNGKVAKVELSAYYTKTNRRKLINAYSDKAPLAAALQILEDCDVLLTSSSGRRLLMNTALIAPKTTKSTQGVAVMNLKKGQRITDAHIYQEDELQNPSRYRKKIPALGALPNGEEGGEQQA